MNYLITGAAGFIGFNLSKMLLDKGHTVVGFDNINSYYNISHKLARLNILNTYNNFYFTQGDIVDTELLSKVWAENSPEYVVHLAAQAGVRYSTENPSAYVQSNLVGFQSILELVKKHRPVNFVYASSSSVYGDGDVPFNESNRVWNPQSLYAATKASNELLAKSYVNMYGIKATGLRLFTAYGPYYRPDMAIYKFAESISLGSPILLYNNGRMKRDFTYISDICDGIILALKRPEDGEIYNIGRGKSIFISELISNLELLLGRRCVISYEPKQIGDVEVTEASIAKAKTNLGFDPKVSIEEGLAKFVEWFNRREHELS